VDATIDLTTREHCLVCGAYESVAVEKPMILSNTKALKDYFNRGAIYTEHTTESMRKAILEVVKKKTALAAQIKELKTTRRREWQKKKVVFEGLVFP
jgi:hypothetical protein